MQIARLVLGPLQTNCWVVSDDAGGPAVVIDPAASPKRILDAVGERGVAAVVLTHRHFDLLGAATEVIAATGAPLVVHEADAAGITTIEGTGADVFGFDDIAPPADRLVREGDVIEAGELTLTVLDTPGHTEGGMSLYAEVHLFAGDTVFAGSVGRTDFPGGDARALSRSIAEKIAPLPPDTVIHPGHGPDTTVGREVRTNIFFPRA